jgi:hypothetical protein
MATKWTAQGLPNGDNQQQQPDQVIPNGWPVEAHRTFPTHAAMKATVAQARVEVNRGGMTHEFPDQFIRRQKPV